MSEKDYIQNPATRNCKNIKYLANIIDVSVITCDSIINTTKIMSRNFNEKRKPVKQNVSIFYSPFSQLPQHY